LLSGNRRQLGNGRVEDLRIRDSLAHAHVEYNLFEARHGHRVLNAELFGYRRRDVFLITLFQSCCHSPCPTNFSLSSSFILPIQRQTKVCRTTYSQLRVRSPPPPASSFRPRFDSAGAKACPIADRQSARSKCYATTRERWCRRR